MESVRVRLFVGTLVGIAGGMLVAEALPLVVWWFAIPIGGLLGGSVFVAPEIRKAAPVAAASAWQSLTYTPVYWKQYNRAPLETKRGLQIKLIFALTVLVYMGAWVASVVVLQRQTGGVHPAVAHVFTLACTAATIAYSGLALPYGDGTTDGLVGNKSSRRRLLIATPLGILVVLALLLFYFISWVVRGVRDALKFAPRFAVELFWQVNSRPLAITAIGSAFGVGTFFPLFRLTLQWEILPATVVGTLTGAMLALAYYELIPKRVLKAH